MEQLVWRVEEGSKVKLKDYRGKQELEQVKRMQQQHE